MSALTIGTELATAVSCIENVLLFVAADDFMRLQIFDFTVYNLHIISLDKIDHRMNTIYVSIHNMYKVYTGEERVGFNVPVKNLIRLLLL